MEKFIPSSLNATTRTSTIRKAKVRCLFVVLWVYCLYICASRSTPRPL
jgi:hypothetical protein